MAPGEESQADRSDPLWGQPGWLSASQRPSVFWAEVDQECFCSGPYCNTRDVKQPLLGTPPLQIPPLNSSSPLADFCQAEGPSHEPTAMRDQQPPKGACPTKSLHKSTPGLLRTQALCSVRGAEQGPGFIWAVWHEMGG